MSNTGKCQFQRDLYLATLLIYAELVTVLTLSPAVFTISNFFYEYLDLMAIKTIFRIFVMVAGNSNQKHR